MGDIMTKHQWKIKRVNVENEKHLRQEERESKSCTNDRIIKQTITDTLKRMQADYRRGKLTKHDETVYARIIGNRLIQELSPEYSGMCSVAAIKEGHKAWTQGDQYYSPTYEHYNPSQVMGMRIVRTFRNRENVNPVLLGKLINEAKKVNKVTYEENISLRKHQKTDKFIDGDTAYDNTGIELRPWPKYTRFSNAKRMYPDLFSVKKRK